MRPSLEICELTTGQRERFAILSIDPSQREGNGCRAVVASLHVTQDEARAALRSLASKEEK